jgi:hypothetical protein
MAVGYDSITLMAHSGKVGVRDQGRTTTIRNTPAVYLLGCIECMPMRLGGEVGIGAGLCGVQAVLHFTRFLGPTLLGGPDSSCMEGIFPDLPTAASG